jgi:arabinan endo-1,5-alpha-L-arabinosidase
MKNYNPSRILPSAANKSTPMKSRNNILVATVLFAMGLAGTATAQIGQPFIHDPSTPMEDNGKYYTFGTGSGGLISEDGWSWKSGAVRPGGGAAPDAMKIGDRYLVVYGATGGGMNGGHNGRILTMWNKTLDPTSPDFKYTEAVQVVYTDGYEHSDAIDPGLFMDPNTGRLWLTFGTYYGFSRIVELDPKTGLRVAGNKEVDIAIDCEATCMIYKEGYYYLLATHGTCCDGSNSTYNIVVGRSKSVTGPFIDNVGRSMIEGGGKLVMASLGNVVGPGHFGYLNIDKNVEKFSCHFEADLELGGRSTLGIRPLLWKNGWPVAGSLLKDGTYKIESGRRGFGLELTIDIVRMGGGGMRMGGGAPAGAAAPAASQIIPRQKLADANASWPAGIINCRMSEYMMRPHQRWTITALNDKPGFLGGSYCKIVIEGTDRALAATAEGEVITVPAFTGAPEQMWRIDQLTDGSYRIMPKAIPGSTKKWVLMSISDATPGLGEYDATSDNYKWNLIAD